MSVASEQWSWGSRLGAEDFGISLGMECSMA